MNTNEKFNTREEYLIAAVEAVKGLFNDAGHTVPAIYVSTGFPSSRGVSQKKKALGECWAKEASEDNRPQIFISPLLDDPIDMDKIAGDGFGVLPVLVHELCHAVAGHKAGHGPGFRRVALAVGLDGKMTSTFPGEALRAKLVAISGDLGLYPHAKLTPALSGKKKQGTRMIKCECPDPECGFTVRTTKKWLTEVGAPHCPRHGEMKFELPEGDDEGEEGNDNE